MTDTIIRAFAELRRRPYLVYFRGSSATTDGFTSADLLRQWVKNRALSLPPPRTAPRPRRRRRLRAVLDLINALSASLSLTRRPIGQVSIHLDISAARDASLQVLIN